MKDRDLRLQFLVAHSKLTDRWAAAKGRGKARRSEINRRILGSCLEASAELRDACECEVGGAEAAQLPSRVGSMTNGSIPAPTAGDGEIPPKRADHLARTAWPSIGLAGIGLLAVLAGVGIVRVKRTPMHERTARVLPLMAKRSHSEKSMPDLESPPRTQAEPGRSNDAPPNRVTDAEPAPAPVAKPAAEDGPGPREAANPESNDAAAASEPAVVAEALRTEADSKVETLPADRILRQKGLVHSGLIYVLEEEREVLQKLGGLNILFANLGDAKAVALGTANNERVVTALKNRSAVLSHRIQELSLRMQAMPKRKTTNIDSDAYAALHSESLALKEELNHIRLEAEGAYRQCAQGEGETRIG